MNEKDQVNEKDKENQSLLRTNYNILTQLREARSARDTAEQQMLRVFEEAQEVRTIIDNELKEYEETKGQLSVMRRQNLVLWKYIRKQFKKIRK